MLWQPTQFSLKFLVIIIIADYKQLHNVPIVNFLFFIKLCQWCTLVVHFVQFNLVYVLYIIAIIEAAHSNLGITFHYNNIIAKIIQ